MIPPQEVYKKLLAKWERGFFYMMHATCFPYEYKLPPISSKQMTEGFGVVDAWIRGFTTHAKFAPFLRYKEVNHRLFGKNNIPTSLLFETPQELASLLGKRGEWDTFIRLTGLLQEHDERLFAWAMRYPIRLLEVAPDIDRVLLLWGWMLDHPRPGIYLRQIDLPGIDTKFTEQHKGLLSQWLDLTLEEEVIDTSYRGVSQFERRYGFLGKPELVRFRLLDPQLHYRGCDDISLPSKQFCELFQEEENLPIERVFVIENDICALTLPPSEKSLVIFGRGYNFEHLRACAWLHRVSLWYWGDIDTHGFAILDQFRSYFPHTNSFLMDRSTLLEHQTSWVSEPKPFTGELHHLKGEESTLYKELAVGTIGQNIRLEQELIRYGKVECAIERISSQ